MFINKIYRWKWDLIFTVTSINLLEVKELEENMTLNIFTSLLVVTKINIAA